MESSLVSSIQCIHPCLFLWKHVFDPYWILENFQVDIITLDGLYCNLMQLGFVRSKTRMWVVLVILLEWREETEIWSLQSSTCLIGSWRLSVPSLSSSWTLIGSQPSSTSSPCPGAHPWSTSWVLRKTGRWHKNILEQIWEFSLKTKFQLKILNHQKIMTIRENKLC